MDSLGLLVWWRVPEGLILRDVRRVVEVAGFEVPAPQAVLPVDAYRRLQSSVRGAYTEAHLTQVFDLRAVENPSAALLVRHIVRTIVRDGEEVSASRVGDVAFFKAPKGQASKGRMQVRMLTHDPVSQQFANVVREHYENALGTLDAQGIRRLIRAHLAHVSAPFVDGPYLVGTEEHLAPLRNLFEALGPTAALYWLPIADTPESEAKLTQWAHLGAQIPE